MLKMDNLLSGFRIPFILNYPEIISGGQYGFVSGLMFYRSWTEVK